MNWKAWASLFAAVLGAGCQTYDFEPVQPLAVSQTTQDRVLIARADRPDLMLLVDKSGSMDLPINAADPDCTTNGLLCGRKGEVDSTPCNVTVCPTRWSELQGAMATFLPNAGNLARMGLAVFPGGTLAHLVAPGCFQPPQPQDVGGAAGVTLDITQTRDVPLELEAQATAVLNSLQQITSTNPPGATGTGGGTPIGPALQMLSNYPLLTTSEREAKFVLLLTDGLPNCNPANPNDYNVDPVACACTLDTERCEALADFGASKEACLDAANSVAAATSLASQGVKTIVVAFGAETGLPAAQTTLNAIATAGGFARNCINGNTCDVGELCDTGGTNLCERRYYQAATREQLEDALAQISAIVDPGCKYDLDAQPESSAFVLVLFNGESLQTSPSTWQLTADGDIEFFGTYCDAIRASTTSDPVNLSIRIVQAL